MTRTKVRKDGAWIYADEAISISSGTASQPYGVFAAYYDLPGVRVDSIANSLYIQSDNLFYQPWIVQREMTIDRLSMIVKGGGNYGLNAMRLGVYAANTAWQATTLVGQGETTGITGDGRKDVTVSLTLTPGLYLAAGVTSGNADFTGYRGLVMGMLTGEGFISEISVAMTYGPLPTTPVTGVIVTGFDMMRYMVFPRITGVN